MGGDIKQHGCFQADLRQVSKIELLIQHIEEKLGQIDVLINNAADFFPTPLGEVSESEWDHLISLNLKAPFFLSQLVGTSMLKQGQGKIVNIADVAAERPWPQFLPYCASKAGLVSFWQPPSPWLKSTTVCSHGSQESDHGKICKAPSNRAKCTQRKANIDAVQ